MVEHLIVVGKVACRDKIQPGIALNLPILRAQIAASGFQRVGVDLAAPEFFQREFQFTLFADAGKAEGVDSGHGRLL